MKRSAKARSGLSSRRKLLLLVFSAVLLCTTLGVIYLDFTVREKFEGKRWELPAKVYARPLELYPTLKLTAGQMKDELNQLGYRQMESPEEHGSYAWEGQTLELATRPFTFGDGFQESISANIVFANGRIRQIIDQSTAATIPLLRLDPPLIGGIYPDKNEDRVLVKLDQVPWQVTDALIAVEDRRFYSHHGIDPKGITRAIVAMATGGQIQGGSTLTQQLVKNFYLTAERSLQRKFIEMIMALLLELHYEKEEILETYLNEVYLGQDGNRAIHGFGLASMFFFNKQISDLDLHEAALLVGMLKGPSYYNPRSRPQRALQRRNLVLQLMEEEEKITPQMAQAASGQPLGVMDRPVRGTSPYPAFLSLVHRQLRQDYREDDLRSQGLQIFTTLDPMVQSAAEKAVQKRLPVLEQTRGMEAGSLQTAVLVASMQNAEVEAVIGGRDPRFEGFNRALDAQRPIGSLIKPVVYLTALQQPDNYTLATKLDDSPLVFKQNGTPDWAPQNFDKTFHDKVLLRDALSQSYNVSTARLGLDLGINKVMANLKRLGVSRDLPQYAASMLGVNTLSPLEITQVYHTIANGGFRTPLKAIREILTADGRPLQRYPLDVEQIVAGEPAFLVTVAMQDAVRQGTAKGLSEDLPEDLAIAGKTGTTDDFRDSWFAGITGDRLAVTWIGRDDNQPTGLTGSSGAMTLWGGMMVQLDPQPLMLVQPDRIEEVWIDPVSGLRSARGCRGAVKLPFIAGSAPTESAPCGSSPVGDKIKGWFERIFK